jgi:hypothetical protein
VADGPSALRTLESAAFEVSLLSPLEEAGATGTPGASRTMVRTAAAVS